VSDTKLHTVLKEIKSLCKTARNNSVRSDPILFISHILLRIVKQ